MMRINYRAALIALSLGLSLTGCASKDSKQELAKRPAAELFTTAQQQLNEGNYAGAIKQLEALDNRYPFGTYAQQAQLDLIYAYYKNADLPMAQATIDRFMRLNPTHPDIDWVIYMRGLTDMALDDSLLQNFFGIDRSDRDPQRARVAFQDFRQLIQTYPNSRYAPDAYKRLVYLKNRLAKYDLSVAQFYVKRGAWVAVVNRVEQMLSDYPDTAATRAALPLMEKAYKKLQLNDEAAKVARLIVANKTH